MKNYRGKQTLYILLLNTALIALALAAGGYLRAFANDEDFFTESYLYEPETHIAVPADEPPAAGREPNVFEVTRDALSGGTVVGGISLNNTSGLNPPFEQLLENGCLKVEKDSEQPQVLVMHTHTTESYMEEGADYYDPADYSARSTDNEQNVAAVGVAFANALAARGIKTLHDATLNDYPEYNGAYDRAAQLISAYLEKYPSIKVVIDLHRDSMTAAGGAKYRPVSEKGGAQLMIVAGSDAGGLPHANYAQNLALALAWQRAMTGLDPTLCRPIDFVKHRYNQHLTAGSLILETGTDANSLGQAKASAVIAAEALADCLLG